MRNAIKNFVKKSLYVGGYYHLCRRLAASKEKRLLILAYHDLAPRGARPNEGWPDDDSPNPSQFEAHLRALTEHCRAVSLKNVIDSIRSGDGLESDSVAITFDDGYESFYSIAYPLLRKYDLPATVFLVTDWVGRDVLPWWHRLRAMLDKAHLSTMNNEELRHVVGPDARVLPPGDKQHPGRQLPFQRALEIKFRNMAKDARDEKLRALEQMLFTNGGFNPRPVRMLSWDQIREMASNKIEFGSHTRTHINMRFAELSIVQNEIRESKAELEGRIQQDVKGFAYPYGQDLASYVGYEQCLRSQGFTYACNASLGNNSAASNLFSLYRAGLPLTESLAIISRELILGLGRNNWN